MARGSRIDPLTGQQIVRHLASLRACREARRSRGITRPFGTSPRSPCALCGCLLAYQGTSPGASHGKSSRSVFPKGFFFPLLKDWRAKQLRSMALGGEGPWQRLLAKNLSVDNVDKDEPQAAMTVAEVFSSHLTCLLFTQAVQ